MNLNKLIKADREDEKEKKEAPDDLMTKLLKTRTIVLADEIDKKQAQKIITQLLLLEADNPDNTPSGMKFSTLAGQVGGGQQTPGFVGHSKHYIGS